ncbi:MAG: NAD(P)/FAD-dependent oxidoreductase [Sterolibacterium sp.]|nr:NAD(P)/FAD-dependent oxidoreductase [Sterolibacterium sp.]
MASPKKDYDVILVGGGINGLTTAAYLQKAGLSVAVFERRDESGTFCATEEVLHPGVKMNLHASMLLPHWAPAFVDLELEKFGLELCAPPGSDYWYFLPFLDGNAALFASHNAKKTYEMWQRLSPKDAETYRKIINFFGPRLPGLLQHLLYSKHTDESFLALLADFENLPIFPKDWLWMTGPELLDCLFENEQIKLGVLSAAAMGGVETINSRLSGPMNVLLSLSIFTVDGAYTARGGSHDLTHSLVRCFVHYGGKIFYNCPVEKVIIENNQAKGVVLSKLACYPEAEFKASKGVISDLSAKPTFFGLVGEEHLSASARVALKRFDYRGASLFTNYYVMSERPNFACSAKFPEVNNIFEFNFGAETMVEASRLLDSVLVRDLPPDPPVAWGGCFNFCIADPTQAPPGQYTLLVWTIVPYEIRPLGGQEKWDDLRESYADKVEEVFVQYLPNLKTAKLARYVNTPHDYVRRNPHCGGNMHPSGSTNENQFWSWKPFAGCGAPKTPIDNLYICQSTDQGNYTWLGASYVAACELIGDLGIARPDWWKAVALDGAQELWRRKGITQTFSID